MKPESSSVELVRCCVDSWASMFTLCCTSSHRCMNEYLAKDSGVNNLSVVITLWLYTSHNVSMVFDISGL